MDDISITVKRMCATTDELNVFCEYSGGDYFLRYDNYANVSVLSTHVIRVGVEQNFLKLAVMTKQTVNMSPENLKAELSGTLDYIDFATYPKEYWAWVPTISQLLDICHISSVAQLNDIHDEFHNIAMVNRTHFPTDIHEFLIAYVMHFVCEKYWFQGRWITMNENRFERQL